VFTVVALARPGLRLWLGDEFAENAAPVLQLLAVSVLLNTLAQGPATLIQAAGQPRAMALLHLVELPVFVAVLYALTLHLGIVGTALAATLRSGLDGLAVLALARRDVAPGALPWRRAALPALVGTTLLAAALWPRAWAEAAVVLFVGLPLFVLFAWQRLLHADERERLLRLTLTRGAA
jgi:O-antigen/teichoic acid export membrane protein